MKGNLLSSNALNAEVSVELCFPTRSAYIFEIWRTSFSTKEVK